MSSRHGMETERLLLRLFRMDDAPEVQRLAGDWDVARTTANIPHPYEAGVAEQWIKNEYEAIAKGKRMTFAIVRRRDDRLIGAISLGVNEIDRWGELGYWIGKPYWNRGYCTEAAKAMIAYGFHDIGLNRIQARHMPSNPASGRVLQKLNMSFEGTSKQILYRHGRFIDLSMYAILKADYEKVGGMETQMT